MNPFAVQLDDPQFASVLFLKRAPKFLRFVVKRSKSCSRNWDALDQLNDAPETGEEILAAKLREFGTMHIDRVVKGRKVGEWYRCAYYELVKDQPSDAVMRSTALWREWCVAQVAEADQ